MPDYREALEGLYGDGFTTIRTDSGDEPLEDYLSRTPRGGGDVDLERADADGVARVFCIVEEGHRAETPMAVVYTANGYASETFFPGGDRPKPPRRPAA
jgi:hypothetical protein